MASRERDIGRHYPSGALKRKAKNEKLKKEEETLSKIPKLTTFFQTHSNTPRPLSEILHPSAAPVSNQDEINIPYEYLKKDPPDVEKSEEIERILNKKAEEKDTTATTIVPHSNKSFSTDLGEWPSKLDDRAKEYWISKGSHDCQNIASDFTSSKRFYKSENKTRFCQKSYFTRIHNLTNAKQDRNWLCYSPSTGCLFCFSCKVMGLESPSIFVEEGFNDWKHGNVGLDRHEESISHKKTVIALLARKKKGERIDSALVSQIESEQQYWRKVLHRIIEVIKFLAIRGLPFRGSNEIIGCPQNGNYLGLLELLAKFDPFLSEHINTHANKGKGHVSYLSKDVCEEFINLIGAKMLDKIISEIKECKYYSVSLDSTPDSANVDQLTLIVRYVLPCGPVERFIKFLDMEGHSSAQLFDSLMNFLKENGIDIRNCRGQSYDNASNMSGKYNGLQALIKEKCQFAEYIPCFAHSLNLVGKCAAESCSEAVRFFTFMENLYTFFSASTHRWSLLTRALSNCDNRLPPPKRLSDTRWSARADASLALSKGYSVIINVLEDIAEDADFKAEARQQARGLLITMKKLETGIMVVLWDQILQRFQITSASLQSSKQNLNSPCALYESLQGYVEALRPTFAVTESKAKVLTDSHQYQEEHFRRRKRNKQMDHLHGFISDDSSIDSMQPSEKFRTGTFLVVIDNLVAALSKRQMAYTKIKGVFGFLRQLSKLTPDQIRAGASKLIQTYPEDIENKLEDELVQFTELLKTDLAEIFCGYEQDLYEMKLYYLIVHNSLGSCFPNVEIVLKIYLTLMVTNCSGERSFSKLKRIKNEVRASMGQKRLNYLSLISIEHELLNEINTSTIIDEFSIAKSRKRLVGI